MEISAHKAYGAVSWKCNGSAYRRAHGPSCTINRHALQRMNILQTNDVACKQMASQLNEKLNRMHYATPAY